MLSPTGRDKLSLQIKVLRAIDIEPSWKLGRCVCVFICLHSATNVTGHLNLLNYLDFSGVSQVALVVKNPPACSRDIRDRGLIYGLERSPGGGHGNALQYSCLEDPMDRGGWQAAVHGVARSWT